MQNLANKLEAIQPCLEYGIVQSGAERLYSVLTSFGEVISKQAVSCLVRPRVGDSVLLSTDEKGSSFILSVLRRGESKDEGTELVLDGQVDFHVKGGGLNFTSDRDISLASRESLAFVSEKISVRADKGEAVIERMSFIGQVLQAHIKRIKIVAKTVENTCCRLTQRLQDSFRFVKDHDEIQAGSTRYLVEDTLTMNSKNAVHMAEEIVTINAGQIHLG